MIELEVLPGFIIAGHNLNKIGYSEDAVQITDRESKLQEHLQKNEIETPNLSAAI